MGLGERIVRTIETRQEHNRKKLPGPFGEYYRHGGNELLYDLPVTTGSLVIDAGGYKGEWTVGMLARYGCRSKLFEPFPHYAKYCSRLFSKNSMVEVFSLALGGSERTADFPVGANDSTSEFRIKDGVEIVTIPVADVAKVIESEPISCMKINIEGGEYEVLERLIETGLTTQCDSFLIQFHNQPSDWESRLKKIEVSLNETHAREWCYPMLWEKWIKKGLI